jgi:(1->4)-alpha-D-glucan 1-alpha-D-glucosylmutase
LDHTDGLYDPFAYFHALQARFADHQAEGRSPDDAARPLPILVEKILGRDEKLPASWPVDGTTGYDFGMLVLGLWVDPQAERAMTALYKSVTGDAYSFAEHLHACKQHVLTHSLVSEISMLATRLQRLAMRHRSFRDFTLLSLSHALREIVAAFPVYRTYLRSVPERNDADAHLIRAAVRLARRRSPSLSPSIFEFAEKQLLGEAADNSAEPPDLNEFALPFQQLTGPIMAKAMEDTAFYRYPRLLALNEVGGQPGRFGITPDEFHGGNEERARSWPLSMTTTSTHDTKRGEDASARIAVLSELPRTWARTLRRWNAFSTEALAGVSEDVQPVPTLRYLLFQAIVGVWPFGWDGTTGREDFVKRLQDFAEKAAREAKERTSWLNPDHDYEAAVKQYVERLLTNSGFMADARSFMDLIAPYGATNALSQSLLRLCSPGVPDTYQGAELWHQPLVDPDNRRAVDFELRHRMLLEIRGRLDDRALLSRELLASFTDGRVKLFVLHVALQARKAKPELFLRGDYEALRADEHVVAFTRGFEGDRLICCVPRLSYVLTKGEKPWPIGDAWGDAELEVRHTGRYRNLLTGAAVEIGSSVKLRDLLADFPLALLFRETEFTT